MAAMGGMRQGILAPKQIQTFKKRQQVMHMESQRERSRACLSRRAAPGAERARMSTSRHPPPDAAGAAQASTIAAEIASKSALKGRSDGTV